MGSKRAPNSPSSLEIRTYVVRTGIPAPLGAGRLGGGGGGTLSSPFAPPDSPRGKQWEIRTVTNKTRKQGQPVYPFVYRILADGTQVWQASTLGIWDITAPIPSLADFMANAHLHHCTLEELKKVRASKQPEHYQVAWPKDVIAWKLSAVFKLEPPLQIPFKQGDRGWLVYEGPCGATFVVVHVRHLWSFLGPSWGRLELTYVRTYLGPLLGPSRVIGPS